MRAVPFATLVLSLLASVPAHAARTAWVSSNHVQVVDLDAGRVVGRLDMRAFVHDLAFTPDGRFGLVASSQGLRVADAEQLSWSQTLLTGTVLAVDVSKDGSRIVALSAPPTEENRAARKSGARAPWTVSVFDGTTFTKTHEFLIDEKGIDLALSPDGAAIYVLLPGHGRIDAFRPDGQLIGHHDVASHLPKERNGAPAAFFSKIDLSADGTRAVLPVTAEGFSAVIDVDLANVRPATERVRQDELGHARRIHGFAWDPDGDLVISAVSALVRFGGHGLPVAWKTYPWTFVDVAPLVGEGSVVVTPTFSETNRSGGVALLDERGEVVRTVELHDMSPFHVAIRPE